MEQSWFAALSRYTPFLFNSFPIIVSSFPERSLSHVYENKIWINSSLDRSKIYSDTGIVLSTASISFFSNLCPVSLSSSTSMGFRSKKSPVILKLFMIPPSAFTATAICPALTRSSRTWSIAGDCPKFHCQVSYFAFFRAAIFSWSFSDKSNTHLLSPTS